MADLPASYSENPIHVYVLDASTSQPLANTFVVAQWIMVKPRGYKGASWYKALHVAAVATDSHGKAVIPAWGPLERPKGWQMMNELSPKFIVFHPGYAPQFLGNNFQITKTQPNHPDLDTGIEIRMRTYDAELAENPPPTTNVTAYSWRPATAIQMLQLLAGQLQSIILSSDNEKLAMSRLSQTLIAVDKEIQQLSAPSVYEWSPPIEKTLAKVRHSNPTTKAKAQ